MKPDAETLAAIAEELRAQPPMEVVWKPESVLQFTGLIQLVLRHPSLRGESTSHESDSRHTAERFLQIVREYLVDCPKTLELIRLGDDPANDV